MLMLAFLLEVLTDTFTQKRYYFEKVKSNSVTVQYDKTIKKYQYLAHITQIGILLPYTIFLLTVSKLRFTNVDIITWEYCAKTALLLVSSIILARFCWFNPIWNKINGQSIHYLGDTDLFDVISKKIFDKFKQSYDGLTWIRFVFSFVVIKLLSLI